MDGNICAIFWVSCPVYPADFCQDILDTANQFHHHHNHQTFSIRVDISTPLHLAWSANSRKWHVVLLWALISSGVYILVIMCNSISFQCNILLRYQLPEIHCFHIQFFDSPHHVSCASSYRSRRLFRLESNFWR